jgi:putative membrane protein
MHGSGYFGMEWGGLWMILIWAIPIVLIVLLARYSFAGDRGEKSSGKSALEILEARYARGEIDRDEYLIRRADLTN